MTDPLKQKNHAETIIEVTKEYTLRPKSGDRVDVCIAVLQYLLDSFAYVDDYANCYVDADDIENLIMELKALK